MISVSSPYIKISYLVFNPTSRLMKQAKSSCYIYVLDIENSAKSHCYNSNQSDQYVKRNKP